MWCDMRFWKVGGYLKKSTQRKIVSPLLFKRHFWEQPQCWLSAALRLHSWGLNSSDEYIIQTSASVCFPTTTSPWQLSWQTDIGTHYCRGFWCYLLTEGMSASLYLLRALALVFTQPGVLAWHQRPGIWKPISSDMREQVTLVPILGNLSDMLSSSDLCWQEKREQEANLFFALVIESGMYCYRNAIYLNTSEGSRSCLLQSV